MKVLFACVCDYANADSSGKLSVNGIFDRIIASSLPAGVPRMNLVFRLAFEYEDNDKQNQISFALIDADGRPHLEAQGAIDHARVLPGAFLTLNHIVEFEQTVLAEAGRYTFVLKADGVEAFRVPFDVVLAP
jgi:hypothetical protein